MPIRSYLNNEQSTFEPEHIQAMSQALESACRALGLIDSDRTVVAERIIALARSGVIDPTALSERVVAEVKAMRSL